MTALVTTTTIMTALVKQQHQKSIGHNITTTTTIMTALKTTTIMTALATTTI